MARNRIFNITCEDHVGTGDEAGDRAKLRLRAADDLLLSDLARVVDAQVLSPADSLGLTDVAHVNVCWGITAVDRVGTRDQRGTCAELGLRTKSQIELQDQSDVENIGYVMGVDTQVAVLDEAHANEELLRQFQDQFTLSTKVKMTGGRLTRPRNQTVQVMGRGRQTKWMIFGR